MPAPSRSSPAGGLARGLRTGSRDLGVAAAWLTPDRMRRLSHHGVCPFLPGLTPYPGANGGEHPPPLGVNCGAAWGGWCSLLRLVEPYSQNSFPYTTFFGSSAAA